MADEDAGVVKKAGAKVQKKRTTRRVTRKKVTAKKRPAKKAAASTVIQERVVVTESPDEQLSRLKEHELLREGATSAAPAEPEPSPNGRIGPMVWGPLLVIGFLVFLIVGEDSESEKAVGAAVTAPYSGRSSRPTGQVQPSMASPHTAKRNGQPVDAGLPGAQYWSPDVPGVVDAKPLAKPPVPTSSRPVYPSPSSSVPRGAAQSGAGYWAAPSPAWGNEGGSGHQIDSLPPPPGASLGMGGGSPWQAMPVPQSAYPPTPALGTSGGYPPVPIPSRQ